MPFSVELGDLDKSVPRDVQLCLRDALDEIVASIVASPPGSTVLSIFRDDVLHLDLLGWRFDYVVDPDRQRVRVTGARQLKEPTRAP